MSILQLNIGEEDVVRLILEFLHTRELHITQLSLERETGVINGNYSNDVIFLRQLILDGQWDDVLVYIQPLSTLKDFQMDKFNYAILRHKYIELLCIRSEIKAYNNVENIVDEVVKVLSQLEKIAPSKEEYSKLCLLLTLPSITDDAQFKKWNPSNARVQCFREVYPLVEQFLPCDKKPSSSGAALKSAKNDRLMQLMIKGIMYEACVKICQTKARGTNEAQLKEVDFSQMLDRPRFNEKDLSLLSWLESVPNETFTIPFDQRTLDVVLEKLVRPSLHTSWTEHILVTPIKPRAYPHLSMPFKRPRSAADAMTRSLRPLPDGAPRHPAVMALSAIDYGPSTSSAAFHLSGAKCSSVMHTSVDRLFHTNDSNVSYHNGQSEKLKPIIDESEKSNETSSIGASNVTTPEHRTQEQYSATPLPKAATPDRSSIADRPAAVVAAHSGDGDFRRELLKQYQQQKQRECDEYLRSLCSSQIIPHQSAEQAGDVQNPYNSPVALRMGHYAAPNIITSTPTRVEEETSGDTIKVTPPRPEHVTENTTDQTVEFFSPTRRLSCTKDEVVLATSPNLAALKNKPAKKTAARPVSAVPESDKPTFKPITLLEDVQVVRCAEFHPNGKLYAVGSNTKTLRICAYPKMDDINWDEVKQGPSPPTVLLKRTKHHKGSIYCLAWNPAGDLLASASNDKTVKLMRFNSNACTLEGLEMELSMHDGTVRDLSFIEDSSNKSSLLVSGGAGDCRIYVTDCAIGNTFQSLGGHTGHVLSLYNWGGAMFVSGSQDKTVRLWDLRVGSCVNVITTTPPNLASAVTSLAVEPSGRLLVSGHEDGFCALHDLRSSRPLQRFALHSSDVRSVRFSPGAYYLLTAGYDGLVVLTDVQGDLTSSLPSVLVARHSDKVIAARWHPEDFSFLSTSADKTSVLWSIPPL